MRCWSALLLLGTLLLAGCYAEPVALTTYPPSDEPSATPVATAAATATPEQSPTPTVPPEQTPTPSVDAGSPTASTAPPSATLDAAATGAPTAGCVNGWTTPASGSAEYDEVLAILDSQMEVTGPWQVFEMRHFFGPDVDWAESPVAVVERWYVRAALVDDPDFRGRWLIEKRADLIKGVVAVAPFDSTGYQTPDWTGFVGDGQPTTYLGLPGQWTGTPYDFVTGGGYSGEHGLPDQVVDCLSAT